MYNNFKKESYMPYIELNYNKTITSSEEKKIKEELGKAISILPGKSEEWLMVEIKDNMKLYFKGDKEKENMMIKVLVYGDTLSESILNKFTAKVSEILINILPGLNKDHIYISYFFTKNWGFNGENF